jgi:hypothetical protein
LSANFIKKADKVLQVAMRLRSTFDHPKKAV